MTFQEKGKILLTKFSIHLWSKKKKKKERKKETSSLNGHRRKIPQHNKGHI